MAAMLKNLFTIGLIALLGLVALKVVFGLLGPLVGLLLWVAGLAIQLALVGAVIYGVIRLVSPETAKRLTSGFRR
jgi:ABC-type multidrug transport system permease subunit